MKDRSFAISLFGVSCLTRLQACRAVNQISYHFQNNKRAINWLWKLKWQYNGLINIKHEILMVKEATKTLVVTPVLRTRFCWDYVSIQKRCFFVIKFMHHASKCKMFLTLISRKRKIWFATRKYKKKCFYMQCFCTLTLRQEYTTYIYQLWKFIRFSSRLEYKQKNCLF